MSREKIVQCQHHAMASQQTLQDYLLANEMVSEQQLSLLLSTHFALQYLDLDSIEMDSIPWRILDAKLMHQLRVVPLMIRENHLILGTDDPSRQSTLKEVQFYTSLSASFILVEASKLTRLIEKINQRKLSEGPRLHSASLMSNNVSMESTESDDDSSIVHFVDQIFFDAIKRKVSDIHFELYDDRYRIRYRLDGILIETATPSPDLAKRITARIKIMSNLDISERRIPQDGRFNVSFNEGSSRDCRVNICPTINGEKVVVRILNPDTSMIRIDELGFNALQKKYFLEAIAKPQGIILVTGPTGSGKTVSLYTALSMLNTCEKNISTAEDPVEIKVSGINQVNINPKVGLTFANVLRSFLRQDPDIIMIGEIRDVETAEIAVKAAQTGHLVLSTLHTNSAAETLTRLNSMGISSFDLGSSINLLIAQRLVRRLCSYCKQAHVETERDTASVYKAVGCNQCMNGYHGRIGIFEVMPVTSTIQQLIISGSPPVEILKQAQEEGMLTVYQAGLEKIKEGLTTIEEVNRVTVRND
ncbi:pilus assembly protein PilB [Legionella hackeliae]|nr:pilus assembly protein PilB [Legionella hackeliae]